MRPPPVVLHADDDVVVVLTAAGLKDVQAVARTRPVVPVVAPRVEALLQALAAHYSVEPRSLPV
ncbi:MAG: hypothetical protein QN183_01135 [Armatimonadota bacterium]|nr:hypothetical protein [Armatimonadota bacterium]MDR7534712.1 hypothetical protein [Armatimonadota bacterium]MDR7534954.1 hypothetical protein [Armatimonadota bacterium]